MVSPLKALHHPKSPQHIRTVGSLIFTLLKTTLEWQWLVVAVVKEMSIKEIALASGYYNVNTFSRNFKAKYSMSPSEYRIIKT